MTPGADPFPGIQGNLVSNPGFESAGSGSLPEGWAVNAHTEAVSLDSDVFHTGSLSMKHQSSSGPSYLAYQEVPVTGGQSYSFLGWVRVSSITGYPRFSLQLLPMNVNGGVDQDAEPGDLYRRHQRVAGGQSSQFGFAGRCGEGPIGDEGG